ncbi:MAG: methionine--tRNA ligase [Candidatus Lokiarchaeota archaeon]|nr:methionine--tRNA ligase [Candidatus Lokiarchaeota archaeon]
MRMMGRSKWVITSAWPYVNAIPHLGNMIGSVLSADVFARYLRLKGDEVILVSGSDQHGTPNKVAALKEGTSPEEFTNRNHEMIKELFLKWGISYDNYTKTHHPNHIQFTQDFFTKIEKNGYIFQQEEEMTYCPNDNMFLPDRFVEGTCPHCESDIPARGDQCDNPACGKLLTPVQLINPHCVICGNTPILKKTKHWYFDYPKFQEPLSKFIEKHEIIPENAKTFCIARLNEGLRPRSITRDLDWGIPAPFRGAVNKTIYVWFEAVLGYISASKEWAINNKTPNKWKEFWFDKNTRTVFFIGKDNIPFHLLMFPALLLATKEDYVLPYNVASTEFLLFETKKFSKSRGVGIWINEALELAPADYWRYFLIFNRPETKDTSFSWREFENAINGDLNDVLGNMINRTLTFIFRYFKGKVPPKRKLDELDENIINLIKNSSENIGSLIEAFEFKKALREIISLAREGNLYLSNKEPWKKIKEKNKLSEVETCLNISIQLVASLSIYLEPFIPFTIKQLRELLNFSNIKINWQDGSKLLIPDEHLIPKPKILFSKIDIIKIQENLSRIRSIKEKKRKDDVMTIKYDDFKKLDIRIAKIISAEKVKNADKLIKLQVQIENEQRQIIAGIGEQYESKDLIDKKIVVLTNLEPKKIRGELSNGMLLAADIDGKPILLIPDKDVPSGSKIL